MSKSVNLNNIQNNQKLLVTFKFNSQRAKSDGLPIYIKIYLDGKRVEIATKYFVQSRYWDSRNFEVKSSHPNYLHINNMLTGIINTVSRHFLELSINGNLVDVIEHWYYKNKLV